jgi:hypothetical protein
LLLLFFPLAGVSPIFRVSSIFGVSPIFLPISW